MPEIAENLSRVREAIRGAALRSGREPGSVKLVAVSKMKPAAMIREAYEAGQRCFGENYAQELRDKAAELSDLAIDWHFIGTLQRNKARYVAPVAAMMESVDSAGLADALSKRALKPLACLIEVNVAGEGSKSGIAPEAALGLAQRIIELPNLELRGVMAIPPIVDDPEASRPYFRRLGSVLDGLNAGLGLPTPLTELSMGMSHDFEVAIEEGATIVRVGTAVFGGR